MEFQSCVRCGCTLKAPQSINVTGDKAIAIFVSALTVGVRPRIKSRAQRTVFCIRCAVSISLGPAPEGAFNLAVYGILQDVVSRDKTIAETAWEQMVSPQRALRRMPGSKVDKTLEVPVLKQPLLSEAS